MMFCNHCGKEIPDQSAFCSFCGKSPTVSTPQPSSHSARPNATAFVILGLALVAVVLVYVSTNSKGTPQIDPAKQLFAAMQPQPILVDKSSNLLSGQITVKAGSMYYVQIKVDTTAMRNARVVGRFTASGGSGNDIQVVLADEDNFENWKNGHEARGLYSTPKITVGNIDVPISQSGTYFLGFSNKFSMFSEKQVSGEIQLHYQVLQSASQ